MHNEAKKYLKFFLLFILPHPKALLQTYVKDSNSNQVVGMLSRVTFLFERFQVGLCIGSRPQKITKFCDLIL